MKASLFKITYSGLLIVLYLYLISFNSVIAQDVNFEIDNSDVSDLDISVPLSDTIKAPPSKEVDLDEWKEVSLPTAELKDKGVEGGAFNTSSFYLRQMSVLGDLTTMRMGRVDTLGRIQDSLNTSVQLVKDFEERKFAKVDTSAFRKPFPFNSAVQPLPSPLDSINSQIDGSKSSFQKKIKNEVNGKIGKVNFIERDFRVFDYYELLFSFRNTQLEQVSLLAGKEIDGIGYLGTGPTLNADKLTDVVGLKSFMKVDFLKSSYFHVELDGFVKNKQSEITGHKKSIGTALKFGIGHIFWFSEKSMYGFNILGLYDFSVQHDLISIRAGLTKRLK